MTKRTRKPTHGGARPGAGRKQLAHETAHPHAVTVRKTACLLREDVAYITRLGSGNYSAGVRVLVERDREGLKTKTVI